MSRLREFEDRFAQSHHDKEAMLNRVRVMRVISSGPVGTDTLVPTTVTKEVRNSISPITRLFLAGSITGLSVLGTVIDRPNVVYALNPKGATPSPTPRETPTPIVVTATPSPTPRETPTPIVVTATPSPTPRETPTPIVVTATPSPFIAPAATPDLSALLRDKLAGIRDLKEFAEEVNELFHESPKDDKGRRQPPPQSAPGPSGTGNNVVVVYPPGPSGDSSVEAGIKAAMAIETITAGRLNEIASATARAGTPTTEPTPKILQVEVKGPVDLRVRDERGLPWWATVLLIVGTVGIGFAIYANRRRIVTILHNRTAPPPPIVP